MRLLRAFAPAALALLSGCSSPAPDAESPSSGELDFSERFGSAGDDYARSAAADAEGAAYVAGFTNGTFEGVESAGDWDAFLTRYGTTGMHDWSLQWGSAGRDFAQAVLVNGEGAIFVAGYSQGAIDDQSNAGGQDAFLTRVEPGGELGWTREWGTEQDEFVYAAASNDAGVFVAGYTEGAFAGSTNVGEADAFVTCFDFAGEPLWTRQWGTTATDYGQAVHADAFGNVLVAGYTYGALGDETNLGSQDAFLIKLDASGELAWIRQWGSATTDYGLSVTSDEHGNLYVTGYTYGAVGEQPSAGVEDAFLSKFDPDGALLWSRQWGTPGADSARYLTLAPNGDVLVAGDTEGSFDGYLSAGERDAFLVRFDSNGEHLSTHQWGTPAQEFSLSVVAVHRDVYVAGYSETEAPEREALLTKWTF